MSHFLLLSCLMLAVGFSVAQTVYYCGDAPYFSTDYVCYDDDILCPIKSGEPYLMCGNDCYSSLMYSCSNGTLAELHHLSNPYQLIADNPTQSFHGQVINACGSHFGIGGEACTYCPVLAGINCTQFLNITAVYNGALPVTVPGGQQVYFYSNGAVGFTQAHSAFLPAGVIYGGFGVAYENGGVFSAPAGNGWYACSASTGGWQVYQDFGTSNVSSACTSLNIKTKDLGPAGASRYAWQYE